ncbi:MAG: hypothetical protein HY360_01405 [Verrucomicrobia bacterium]|nr:hypothetical protein [Verrucomicrobiota bacterium]
MMTTSAFAATDGLIADSCFNEPMAEAGDKVSASGWSLPAVDGERWQQTALADGPAKTGLCWSAGEKDDVSEAVSTSFDAEYYGEYEVSFALRCDPGVALRVTVGGDRLLAELTAHPATWQRQRLRFNTRDVGGKIPLRLAGTRVKPPAGKPSARLWITDVQVCPVPFSVAGRVNLAKGRPYSFLAPPDYPHCTDPGDVKQLTDGVRTEGYFWGQKSTVGWGAAGDKGITIDLGADKPIAGVAVSSAAGAAGAEWPDHLYILASADGNNVFLAGDLVTLSREENGDPPFGRYSHHTFRTTRLPTHARYLTVAAQTPPQCNFFFVDEIEVYQGDPASLTRPYEGDWFPGVEAFAKAEAGRGAYLDEAKQLDRKLALEGMKKIAAQYPRYKEILRQAAASSSCKAAALALQKEWERVLAAERGGCFEGFWRADALVDRTENLKSRFFLNQVQGGAK